MPSNTTFYPVFDRPPVVQTRIGLQFSPLVDLQSGHFGILWSECLNLTEWAIREDLAPLPRETEQFGDKRLRPPVEPAEPDFPGVRMHLVNAENTKAVEFQGNRLRCLWSAGPNRPTAYTDLKAEFGNLFGRLGQFARKWKLGVPRPNLWEVAYVNLVPQGTLWTEPGDWSRILPTLFVGAGPTVTNHPWATFGGEWYFEIPPQVGRVKVTVRKVVVNQKGDVALFFEVAARGELPDGSGEPDWTTALDTGHAAAVRVFYDLTSPEAKRSWGERT